MLIDNNRYYLWGTGKHAKYLMSMYGYLMDGINIIGWIDSNKDVESNIFYGKKVFLPSVLEEDISAKIVICTIHRTEIVAQIEESYPYLLDKIEPENFFEKLNLLYRYKNENDKEIKEICDYLRESNLSVFNYPFINKYDKELYDIEYDENEQMYYTKCGEEQKKLYFSKSFKSIEEVKAYYYSIEIEQDLKSPHRYLSDSFDVKEGSVVIDAGVAEGNFALSVIDKVKKIYLFEPDSDWVQALKCTFKNYAEKVVIINKFLSDYINEHTTTIDSIVNEKVDFIKLDVEGEELYVLKGSTKTLENSEIKVLVATYHQEFAYDVIKEFLVENKFEVETTKGYMWYPNLTNPYRAPILRRGLIRAKRL